MRKIKKNTKQFNQHLMLTKISVILNRLNTKICNKKQLTLLKVLIAKEQSLNIKLEQWASEKMGTHHQGEYHLN